MGRLTIKGTARHSNSSSDTATEPRTRLLLEQREPAAACWQGAAAAAGRGARQSAAEFAADLLLLLVPRWLRGIPEAFVAAPSTLPAAFESCRRPTPLNKKTLSGSGDTSSLGKCTFGVGSLTTYSFEQDSVWSSLSS